MKPAPSAIKYFRYRRDHVPCAINDPPSIFAPAAVTPSSSPSRIRFVPGDVIKSAIPSQSEENCHPERSEGSAFSCKFITRHSALATASSRMPEQDHIAVLHDVLFSFQPHLRLLARGRKTSGLHQILPIHNFGLDETALDVAVNRARGLLRVHPATNRPRATLRLARGEK